MAFNLLFVSIAFPPKNDPECLQTARYFKYLSDDPDFQIDVITSKSPTLFMPDDEGLKKHNVAYRQKIQIPIFETKLTNFGLRKIGCEAMMLPDSRMTFHWQWKQAASQLRHKPDIIYSRSNPMSSAFMAKKLKTHFGCEWVMHLSDPWALSPLHKPSRENYKEHETKLLAEAAAVTFTSNGTLNLYKNNYPYFESKFHLLPNVYDGDDALPVFTSSEPKLTIVYTGGLTGERSAFFLENVLKELDELDSKAKEDLQIIFAGELDRANTGFFKRPKAYVNHVGRIPYSQVQQLYKKAHILMVVDNPTTPEDAIFFPSKILDYFLTQKKILAITPTGSTTRDVLNDYNHAAFEHRESKKITAFIVEALQHWRAGNAGYFFATGIPTKFDAKKNADKLATILKNITNKKH
jgi:hypothetical protein